MKPSENQQLVDRVVQWSLAKKAEDLRVMDLRGLLDVTDWFVLATGFSEIQVQAIADAIADGAGAEGFDLSHVEGRDAGRWVLLDFIDVVVHVMLPEERDRYRLDRLWGESGLIAYDDAGRARTVRESTVPEHVDETQDEADEEVLHRAFEDGTDDDSTEEEG